MADAQQAFVVGVAFESAFALAVVDRHLADGDRQRRQALGGDDVDRTAHQGVGDVLRAVDQARLLILGAGLPAFRDGLELGQDFVADVAAQGGGGDLDCFLGCRRCRRFFFGQTILQWFVRLRKNKIPARLSGSAVRTTQQHCGKLGQRGHGVLWKTERAFRRLDARTTMLECEKCP
jgi:hypothetical protein